MLLAASIETMANFLGETALHGYLLRFEPSVIVLSFFVSLVLLPAITFASIYHIGQRSKDDQPKGCTRVGLRARSHLADQYDEQYYVPQTQSMNGAANITPKIKSLWIYPVKSCKGIELESGSVLRTGMEHDRLFCFAQLKSPFPVSLDTPDMEKSKHQWQFISQRTFSSMALIKTELWLPDLSSPTYSNSRSEVQSGGVVVIKYPSIVGSGFWGLLLYLWVAIGGSKPEKAVHFPLNPTIKQIEDNGYVLEEMRIWKDTPKCLNLGTTIEPEAKPYLEELQALLGCTNPLALFRITTEHSRELYRCAPRKEQLGWQPKIAFVDAYPLHIMNLASVRDVGSNLQRGPQKLSALRFRPNIIFSGSEAYAEDRWKRIRIGHYEYFVSCRTVRCLLPNVDPDTGLKHGSEPNRTLKSFRCIDEGDAKNACLGMQMVC